jgi:hypothetical protein
LPNIQTCCTIIFVTLPFLWYEDEFHEVKGGHFLPELFSISGLMQTIEHLAVQIFGKVGKQWIPLCLYADKEFPDLVCHVQWIPLHFYADNELPVPDLCPVQVLLIFFCTSLIGNWKGGYISPLLKVCHPCKNIKVGCQMWRKTGYYMAIFGAANGDVLEVLARHSQKSKDASTYF